jgi:hypothetical protein
MWTPRQPVTIVAAMARLILTGDVNLFTTER